MTATREHWERRRDFLAERWLELSKQVDLEGLTLSRDGYEVANPKLRALIAVQREVFRLEDRMGPILHARKAIIQEVNSLNRTLEDERARVAHELGLQVSDLQWISGSPAPYRTYLDVPSAKFRESGRPMRRQGVQCQAVTRSELVDISQTLWKRTGTKYTGTYYFRRCRRTCTAPVDYGFCAIHVPLEWYCEETAVDGEGRCTSCGNWRPRMGRHLKNPLNSPKPPAPRPDYYDYPPPRPIDEALSLSEEVLALHEQGRLRDEPFDKLRELVGEYWARRQSWAEWRPQ